MKQKRFDVWDNQFDGKVFPEVNEEKFKIKDKAVVRELNDMMHQPERKDQNIIHGSQEFVEKSQNVLNALDSFKVNQPSTITNQWVYYSLEDVEIDDSKMINNAHDFLNDLKKRNEPQNTAVAEVMDMEFKPTFNARSDKSSVGKGKRSKAEMERSKLSFGDDL